MRLRWPRTALSCSVLAFIAVAVACQEPTQVKIVIKTREQCANISRVQTIVGPNPEETQDRFERKYSTGVSDSCEPADGLIGTLVITPGGDGGSILVAVGVRGGDGTAPPDASNCYEPETAKRCIIARRAFTFIENKPLILPIELDPLCVGQSCDPASTCFKGSCVSANVVCAGADCGLVQENPGGVGEGGATDAFSGDGAYDADRDGAGPFEDATMNDSSAQTDAVADGGDASFGDAGSVPECGNWMDAGASYFCSIPQNPAMSASSNECNPPASPCCRCRCPGTAIVKSCGMLSCFITCP